MQAGSKQIKTAQGSPKQAVLSTFCVAAPTPAIAAHTSREKPGSFNGRVSHMVSKGQCTHDSRTRGHEQRRAGPPDPAAGDEVKSSHE